MAAKHWEQNKDATVYVGNIDERFTQELLAELMTQVGPVRQVHMPQDRVSQTHQGYGFVEFDTPQSADYAAKVLNSIRIWGKPIRVNKASADKQKAVDIGAELYIGNLDPQVDEKVLYDTFSRFGVILRQPSIVRDDNNISRGFGFVSFDSFEASDAALETMNNQYILGRMVSIQYALKKDGKGERHGDEAERKLAAEGKKHNIVPERQQLPAAYHMSGPAGGTSIPAASPVGNSFPETPGVPPVAPSAAPAAPSLPPLAYGLPPNPMVPGRPPMPGAPAYGAVPPPNGLGRPGALPPAPSGLPARPPPSAVGYTGPVGDYHPGGPGAPGAFPRVPPPAPGAPPGALYPAMPPPGFAPPGFAPPNGVPPGPPAGFGVPPPGFSQPPAMPPPPAGFGGSRR